MVDASTMPGVVRRPKVSGGRHSLRADRPTWKERLAVLTINRPGRKLPRYLALAERFLATHRPALAIDLLLGAPRTIRRRTRTRNLLLRACTQARDQVRALAALVTARADHPRDTGVLIALSELYRDAAQFDEARALLLAAETLGSDQPVRRAAIDIATRDLAAGRDNLRRAASMRGARLLRSAPSVLEIAVHYPELASEIAHFRAAVRAAVHSDVIDDVSPADRIRLALRCRMIDEAQRVHDTAVARGLPLDDRVRRAYAAIRNAVEPLGDLARLGWDNEDGASGQVAALVDGRPARIDPATFDPRRIVEVFIPRAFYRPEDAPIVQSAFLVMAERVARRQGVALVPRHQFNLRACRPLLTGKVISFHTHGEDDPRHLRYKDGALAGYVTIDHRGYGGFASIATDFGEIRRTVADISGDELRRNRAALYAEFVEKGRSKHPQPAEPVAFKSRYVFVALQKVDDEVAELVSMSSLDLLRHVARIYRGTGTIVVAKRHPYCKSYVVQAAMQELERQGLVVVSTASIHSLLAKAEVVFTANSGVGLEALVHGRPVVVSGACEYAYAAARAHDAADLADAIDEAKQMTERGAEFLYFYTHRYGFSASDTDRLQRRVDDWLDQPLITP